MVVNGKVVKISDEAQVQNSQWVESLSSISSEHSRDAHFEDRSDNCVLEPDGTIEVMGFTRDGRALVEYTYPWGSFGGTFCMSGTQYLVQPEEFVVFTK